MKQSVIAIDGPAGAGKSTVARMVADRLGYVYVDTGAMYRTVSCCMLYAGLSATDVSAVGKLAAETEIRFIRAGNVTRVLANEADVTEAIRTPEVTQAVAAVSQIPEVRNVMSRQQRQMAQAGRAVLDGRDIGTVVVPEACTKVFLTASVDERARRRWLEMRQKGRDTALEKLQGEIRERDAQDSARELAPLKQADDAIFLDTTGMSIDDVVESILKIHKDRCCDV